MGALGPPRPTFWCAARAAAGTCPKPPNPAAEAPITAPNQAAEAVAPVEIPRIVDRGGVGRRRAEAGQLRGVEEGDERLDVCRRLLGSHASPGGRHRQDIEAGVEEGDGQRDGVIDAGINVQNQLARQG